jgi:polyphenol oxidase
MSMQAAKVSFDWIVPPWAAPAGVSALFTTRSGGVSPPPWGRSPGQGEGMNLGFGSGDDPARVRENRELLRRVLPGDPYWLRQVHGSVVVDADGNRAEGDTSVPPEADASVALRPGAVCAVMVADCMPVLLADAAGRGVAAAHAGWRGLADGVVQATAARLRARLDDPAAPLVAWLGPCIGPARFEVGRDVLDAMQKRLPDAERAFMPLLTGKYLADLPALARQALAMAAVSDIAGGAWCTVSDPLRFFSYRRDGVTGRHVALIWRS